MIYVVHQKSQIRVPVAPQKELLSSKKLQKSSNFQDAKPKKEKYE